MGNEKIYAWTACKPLVHQGAQMTFVVGRRLAQPTSLSKALLSAETSKGIRRDLGLSCRA